MMMPTQEEFDKLPQLDRIEFRQKLDSINKRFSESYVGALAFLILMMGGFASVIYLNLVAIASKEVIVMFLSKMIFMAKVGVIGIIVSMAADFLMMFKRKKAFAELMRKYFKVSEKKKSEKKK